MQLVSFLLVCQFLASLLHLLLLSPVPPLLSVLLVFYLNPNILPHCEEALPPPKAIFIIKKPPKTICFLIYLAVCLKVFKCLTMKTNAHLPLFSRHLLLPRKNALSGFLLHCSRHIFNLDAVIVWLPNSAQMLSKSDCQLKDVITGRAASYISLSSCCLALLTTADAARSYSTGEQDNPGLNVLVSFFFLFLQKQLLYLKSLATKAFLVTIEKRRRNRKTAWVLQKKKKNPCGAQHNTIQQARWGVDPQR